MKRGWLSDVFRQRPKAAAEIHETKQQSAPTRQDLSRYVLTNDSVVAEPCDTALIRWQWNDHLVPETEMAVTDAALAGLLPEELKPEDTRGAKQQPEHLSGPDSDVIVVYSTSAFTVGQRPCLILAFSTTRLVTIRSMTLDEDVTARVTEEFGKLSNDGKAVDPSVSTAHCAYGVLSGLLDALDREFEDREGDADLIAESVEPDVGADERRVEQALPTGDTLRKAQRLKAEFSRLRKMFAAYARIASAVADDSYGAFRLQPAAVVTTVTTDKKAAVVTTDAEMRVERFLTQQITLLGEIVARMPRRDAEGDRAANLFRRLRERCDRGIAAAETWRDRLDVIQVDATNMIIHRVAVASAYFLPATVVAGAFGMNNNVALFTQPWGLIAAAGLGLFVGPGLLLAFVRQRMSVPSIVLVSFGFLLLLVAGALFRGWLPGW